MHSNGKRFDQCCDIKAKAFWQAVKRVRGHDPAALHRTIGIKAKEFQVMADMGIPGRAGRAIAARCKRPHHNSLARGKVCALTCRGNNARHFVPDDPVMANAGIHVAVVDVHVSAADANESYIHRNFVRPGLAVCNGFDGELPAPTIEGCVLGHGKGPFR